jgi:hypothetical protein
MRFLRHISFSNVIALLALFIALGGAAYAGTKINGNSIKNASIGGGKLKKETIGAGKLKKGVITTAQIQPGSITSNSIDLTTLGTVPSAQTATTAHTATNANKATSATTAGTANSATNAKHAETANSATHAASADSATTAGTANSATTAANATHADTATEAETLGGETAADLTISCQAGTELYGGMCWDETTRAPKFWLAAVKECGDAGGRLPTIDELIAFVLQEGPQVSGQTWSGDLSELEGVAKKEVAFTTDENGRGVAVGTSGTLGFRCVFYRSN